MACTVFNAFDGCIGELAEQRPTLQGIDAEIFSSNSPVKKSLIEISGFAESGKSMLLWRLMSHCLTPTYFGGRNCDVIFIDLRHKFDIENFELQIKRLVKSSGEKCTPVELDEVLEKCSDSLHSLNCYSSKHFDAALEMADVLLLKYSDCALIAIDGLDAFYWEDAYVRRMRMQTHYACIVKRLHSLCDRHGVCCAYTVNANYLSSKRMKITEGKECNTSNGLSNVQVDYKFLLQLRPNGERLLNGMPVQIKDDGLHTRKA